MGNFVGLTEYNTLGRGGTNLGQEAGNLRGQLQNLVSELESSRDAMQGNQAGAFDRAKQELFIRFDELTAWCNQHGIKLADSQQVVNQTDTSNEDAFAGAGGQIGGLSRPVNG
jgi:uncharacterized protein YukE